MEGEKRFQAIRNYVDAAAAIQSLKHPQAQFGEIIALALSTAKPGPSSSSPAPSNVWTSNRHLLVGMLESPERGILPRRRGSRPALPQSRAWFTATTSRRTSWSQMMAAFAASLTSAH
jgi:hypothetical protein